MADPVHQLRAMLQSGAPVSWSALMTTIGDLSTTHSEDREHVLVELLTSSHELSFTGGPMPHSQPPLDMVRAAAIDALSKWTGSKHATVCRQAAATTNSPIVKRLVAARFPE